MAATTYMVVDPRRDHSFRIPRPDQGAALGTPDACSACHADRGARWAADVIAGWYPRRKPGFQVFAESFAAADRGEAVDSELLGMLGDPARPALVRASALWRLRAPGQQGHPAIFRALGDADPLLRATAADVLADAEPAARADRLPALLGDSSRAVRMAAARALAGEAEHGLPPGTRARFDAALAEWLAAQQFGADRPENLTAIGTLDLARGQPEQASAWFRRALSVDPGYVQATVNLAEARRLLGDEAGAESSLRDALARDPNAAVLHHALGLSLVRQARLPEALQALERAAALAPEIARYAFVHAVALHDTGQLGAALSALRAASLRHPADRDLQQALAAWEAEAR
jgi:tetratricopeptide (TPR) repeat protein